MCFVSVPYLGGREDEEVAGLELFGLVVSPVDQRLLESLPLGLAHPPEEQENGIVSGTGR